MESAGIWRITLGDILTATVILVSAGGLLLSWMRDRRLRIRQEADDVRAAAAKILASLDRWRETSLSLFEEFQPIVIDITDEIGDEGSVIRARDMMWKHVHVSRLRVLRELHNEKTVTAFSDLYPYHSAAHELIRAALTVLREAEYKAFSSLRDGTEEYLRSLEGKEHELDRATVGNDLRT